MTLNRFILQVIAITLGAPLISHCETLEEAVLNMLRFEPELMAVDSDSRSSFADYKVARSGLLPQVTLSSDSGYSRRDRSTDALFNSSSGDLYSRDFGVSISQLLYDGGETRSRTNAAKEAYYAQRLLQMGIIEDRIVDLAEVYLELIRLDDQLAVARDNVADHKDFRRKLIRREQQGGVRSDTSLIDGRLSLAENSLATMQLAKDTAISRYERLTGRKPGHLSKPRIPFINAQADTVDLSGNWHYLAACATFHSAFETLKAQQATHGPNFYIDAGASEGYDTIGVEGRDREVHALIGVQWDLYRGGRRKALECREYWQTEKARDLLKAADENRRHKARDILNERKGSRASRVSLEQYVNRLVSVAEDYEKQFSIGNRDLLNLLDIKNEHFQAKSKLIDAQFNENMSNYRLMGVQGRMAKHLLGERITKFVGTGCKQKDDWYCELKKKNCLVSCKCEEIENCGPDRCQVQINCPPECDTDLTTVGIFKDCAADRKPILAIPVHGNYPTVFSRKIVHSKPARVSGRKTSFKRR